ncbi:MAG: tRNA glutamyl-Q(34) synthetase GluQRS [Pseudomonadota bacterium]
MRSPHTERFAPSPTGRLHLGHAYSAILAHDRAKAAGGHFLLRMEDLDLSRVREEFYTAIEEDLEWLGLTWEPGVLRQSTRQMAYQQALDRLSAVGLTYACTCTRRDIAEATRAPQEGSPMLGPDGLVYPGTCRGKAIADGAEQAVRLHLEAAIEWLGSNTVSKLMIDESGIGAGHRALDPTQLIAGTGDIVLRRRDGAIAYHLAVVVDDAHQGVTHVTRGEDLAPAAPIQRLLQALLDLPAVHYYHHRLIRDETGKRLAKRDDALSLATLRSEGVQPHDIRRRLQL